MPIWRPAAVEADKEAIRNIVWQGLHLSGATNLVRLNHNLFAFLAHASKRARKELLGGALADAFAERLSRPDVHAALADAMRDLGILGRQKWNTKIYFTRHMIVNGQEYFEPTPGPGYPPEYRDTKDGCSLGPLGMFWEILYPPRGPDKTVDEVRELIYGAVPWTPEVVRRALDRSRPFEWKSLLDGALGRVLGDYDYPEIIENNYVGYRRDEVMGIVSGSSIGEFYDLPTDERAFGEQLRERVLQQASNVVTEWFDSVRNQTLPQDAADWLAEVRAWWLLIRTYVSFGFQEADWIHSAVDCVERLYRPFVELNWSDLVAAEHEFLLDAVAPHHGYDWNSDAVDRQRAARDALAAVCYGGLRGIVGSAVARSHEVLWGLLAEATGEARASYERGQLPLSQCPDVLMAVGELICLLQDCYGEDFFSTSLQNADARIPAACEWILGQSLILMPAEEILQFLEEEPAPDVGWRNDLDMWLDQRLIDAITRGKVPFPVGPPEPAAVERGHDPLSRLRDRWDPRRSRGTHLVEKWIPSDPVVRRYLGWGAQPDYLINRLIVLKDWYSLKTHLMSAAKAASSKAAAERAALLVVAVRHLPYLGDIAQVWQALGGDRATLSTVPTSRPSFSQILMVALHKKATALGVRGPAQIESRPPAHARLEKMTGYTSEKEKRRAPTPIKLLTTLWPEGTLRAAGFIPPSKKSS
jgi:hypothetical protein